MGAGQRGRGSCFPAAGAPCLTSWGCPIPAGIRGQVGCGPDLAPVIAVRTPAGSTGSGTDDLRGPFQPSHSVMVVPFYLAAGYPHDPEARRAGRGGAGRRPAALRAPGERDGGCGEEPGRERRPNPPQRLRPPNRSSAPPPGRSAALPGLSERYRPKADAPSCAEPTGRRLSEQLIACSATDSPGRRACEETLAKRLTAIAAASPPETERCGTARRGRPAMRHCGLCWVGLGCAPRRRSPPLRPGRTDPRLRAFAAPRENAHRVPGGAPLLPAAPPRTGRRRSRRHLIPAAPPPHWPSGPPRGPAPPGLPVAIGRRRYRLATIGRFERTTADPRGGKRTHPPLRAGHAGSCRRCELPPPAGALPAPHLSQLCPWLLCSPLPPGRTAEEPPRRCGVLGGKQSLSPVPCFGLLCRELHRVRGWRLREAGPRISPYPAPQIAGLCGTQRQSCAGAELLDLSQPPWTR